MPPHPTTPHAIAIELPFPAKVLWPNGRTRSHMFRHREFKKHKDWAYWAVKAILPPCFHPVLEKRVSWSATFYPKTRNVIDKDNAAASLKSFQDGIALALGINDTLFDNPTIHFAEPSKPAKVVILIGEAS